MNYRHAYHAGNHTEVFKHSVLVLLLQHLRKKPQPFMVLDTHAGVGIYDLTSAEAEKTGEAQEGIGRVIGKDLLTAAPYLDIVRKVNPRSLDRYPGSPAIVQSLLRENDRLIACELHDEDAGLLRAKFRDDRRVSIHNRDGYEAVLAFVPPPERRGLVFLDPPFEIADEHDCLVQAVVSGIRKWSTGMFAAWYPIKDQSATRAFQTRLMSGATSKVLAVELVPFPVDGERLAGSGMIVCNPPWQFDQVLKSLCSELLAAFGGSQGRWSVEWLAPQH